LFTAVVRITGAGRLDDFRERLRWLMVRDEDGEEYTEHHGAGTLEYRFRPRRGIPFPAFTAASADFPELRVEAEWERDGEHGRAVIENGRLVEQTASRLEEAQLDVKVDDAARLELGLTCRPSEGGGLIGYAVTQDRHTYWRYRDGTLTLLDPEEPDSELEDVAFHFVDEWIWYDEEEAALERVRYAHYGYPVRGANVKSEKLAFLRAQNGRYSSIGEEAQAAREAIVAQWLKR
jgi:hypothetical protein